MKGTPPTRPGWWLYVLGVVLMAGGAGVFAYLLWNGLSHIPDSLIQVVVPGAAQLSLKQGQAYTVFLEPESVVNGKIYSTNDSVSSLSCKVHSSFGTDAIPLFRSVGSTSYKLGRRSGQSVLEFRVPGDGMYEFGCRYGEGEQGPETVVAVGSGLPEKITRITLVSIFAMFGGVGAGLLVCILTFALRRRAGNGSSVPSATAV